ncbi:MAG TPA: hypothetical protein VGN12_24475 [Pirellulales bacterium]
MKRVLLGFSLVCLSLGAPGCCCWQGSGWSPCAWPGCGWGDSCGGGDCGGGGCGGGCGGKGGCGEIYWGDWCTGNPHCSTCDGCGNWVGPPSPGGNGLGPDTYSRAHPYGNQVVRSGPPRSQSQMQMQSQMARRSPPPEYAPKMVKRGPRSYNGQPRMQGQPQYAQRGPVQEYEGAIQHLGTTDRLVKPATLPGRSSSSVSSVARRDEPTLAEPQLDDVEQPQVRRTSQRTYVR